MRVLLLIALLLTACGSGGPSPSASKGVLDGLVVATPGCPVERAGSPCPPRPASGSLVIARQDGRERARATTSTDGRFTLWLAPGAYDVAVTGFFPSDATRVVIVTGETRHVTLTVDSGIR